MRYYAPLRYPGGKASLAQFVRQIFVDNELLGGVYVEPYCGGSAIGLELLMTGYVSEIWLNDIDPAIFAFWKAALNHGDELIERLNTTPLTIKEWRRQRAIYLKPPQRDHVALGFAALYLNRTNRSGILNGGVIGGFKQEGKWSIDARFNRDALADRLRRLAHYRHRIKSRAGTPRRSSISLSFPSDPWFMPTRPTTTTANASTGTITSRTITLGWRRLSSASSGTAGSCHTTTSPRLRNSTPNGGAFDIRFNTAPKISASVASY